MYVSVSRGAGVERFHGLLEQSSLSSAGDIAHWVWTVSSLTFIF